MYIHVSPCRLCCFRSRSKSSVRIKIFFVWVAALTISSPIMILGLVDEKNILSSQHQCVLSNAHFIIYGSVSAFYIPLIIMGILFGLTIHLLRKQYKLCNPKQTQDGEQLIRRIQSSSTMSFKRRWKQMQHDHTQPGRKKESSSSSSSQSSPSRKDLKLNISDVTNIPSPSYISTPLVQCTSSPVAGRSLQLPVSNEYRLHLEQIHKNAMPIDEQSSDESITRSHSMETTRTSIPSFPPTTPCDPDEVDSPVNDLNDNEAKPVSRAFSHPAELNSIHRQVSVASSQNSPTGTKKDSVKQKQVKSTVKTEQKASKTLGILFLCFVLCWAPFFIVNILTVLCRTCVFDRVLITTVLYLGYLSSTLNPIIYTVFNKTFRATMFKLLKCQYKAIQRPMRIKAICVGLKYTHQNGVHRERAQMPL